RYLEEDGSYGVAGDAQPGGGLRHRRSYRRHGKRPHCPMGHALCLAPYPGVAVCRRFRQARSADGSAGTGLHAGLIHSSCPVRSSSAHLRVSVLRPIPNRWAASTRRPRQWARAAEINTLSKSRVSVAMMAGSLRDSRSRTSSSSSVAQSVLTAAGLASASTTGVLVAT